jgi:hypothetical protein
MLYYFLRLPPHFFRLPPQPYLLPLFLVIPALGVDGLFLPVLFVAIVVIIRGYKGTNNN